MPTCLQTYTPTYLHTYIPTYLHTYIPTYLHTYIPTYIHTNIHTYIHIYIHMYLISPRRIKGGSPIRRRIMASLLESCKPRRIVLKLQLKIYIWSAGSRKVSGRAFGHELMELQGMKTKDATRIFKTPIFMSPSIWNCKACWKPFSLGCHPSSFKAGNCAVYAALCTGPAPTLSTHSCKVWNTNSIHHKLAGFISNMLGTKFLTHTHIYI